MSQRYDCTNPEDRTTGLAAAAAAIRRGALVVFPTDSAYAVACDAFRISATAALRTAKGRPSDAALPVLLAAPAVVDALTYALPPAGRGLIAALWPGPLTLIARQQPSLAWDVDPSSSVAVRMPLHPVALELLDSTGPLAATGANYSAMPVPLTCDDAQAQLGDAVAVFLDAGPMDPARSSAVVDVTLTPPQVLRAGSVDVGHLQRICPELTVR
jgi:tRNA threonylcarbamoyl adenosine modification protein (Sua5/YciO/YrdC/YwlC family)